VIRRPSRGRTVGLALVAVLAVGCSPAPIATATATPEPTTHVLALDWGKADVVDAPPGDATASTPPYINPGSLGHPEHYQGGQADLLDVALTSVGLVAVGYDDRAVTASAWLSTDPRRWGRIAAFPAADGSQAVAVSDGPGGVVAVGSAGDHAAAWSSTDGRSWSAAPDAPDLHDSTQVRMTGVASSPAGYVAVGYLGGLAGPIEARFWWSPDGRAWTRGTLDGTPAGTRVAAVEAVPGTGFLAVGATGDARIADGSAAWTSPDGRTWTRVADQPALRAGVMRELTLAGGLGLVVVGNSADSTRAVVWRSTDGAAWTVAPDAPSLDDFGLGIEMHDVAWDGTRLVAVGHRLFGTQYPTGLAWVSTDALTWERANESAALSQGKIEGVTAVGGGFAAVGTFGAPDAAIPTVWLSPP
jgi:hypothetical protein